MDERVPDAVVRGLRQRGVDVATVAGAGAMGASDVDHLRSGQRQGRTIFAPDDDCLRLAACGEPHAGIA
jgi:predicted nuclease of predicted toxin-antitoxin system